MKEDELDGYYEEETYTKGLSREDTIERQVRICAFYYSRGLWNEFEYSLKMLIALLPKELRERLSTLQIDTSSKEIIEKHFKRFVEIQETLELDTNMIFKKKFIKTYQ
jgi:hypothetical protein